MNWEPVIGLEVHAQLKTKSKIFCACPAEFGGEPNDQVCPVCLGMPGVLPVLNKRAVEFAVKAGLALNCTIAELTRFDRKNYFYPDLPKGYQISQFDQPVCTNGHLLINGKKIRIHRAHLEEDAGKLVHAGSAGLQGSDYSKVDFNRSGVPLLEIVSEPDITNAEEARLYLTELRNILRYIGVCDGNLEEGSFRCDANVSVRPAGSEKLGTKTEIKNMNSFQSVKNAIQSEIDRQIAALDRGERIVQETRLWSDPDKTTFVMRSKEEAHDYRYFPEPDLVPLAIDKKWVEEIRSTIAELPESRRQRYISKHGLTLDEAMTLAESKELSDFFDSVLNLGVPAKQAANYLLNTTIGYLKENKLDFSDLKLTPANLGDIVSAVAEGTISATAAKTLVNTVSAEGGDILPTIERLGLTQVSDESALREKVNDVLKNSPSQIEEYKKGRTKVRQYFFGEVMKTCQGKANPQVVNKLLDELLPPPEPANV